MSADLNLDNIKAEFGVHGSVDLDLASVATVLSSGVKADVGLGNVGLHVQGVVDAGLGNVNLKVDASLDDLRIKELAPVRADVSIKEVPLVRTESKVDLGLDNIRIRELPPLKIELSLRPLRVHLPLNYTFCLEFLGFRLVEFSLCGEGMVVTEDYRPCASGEG